MTISTVQTTSTMYFALTTGYNWLIAKGVNMDTSAHVTRCLGASLRILGYRLVT